MRSTSLTIRSLIEFNCQTTEMLYQKTVGVETDEKCDKMYVIATFEHSLYLELAITSLEKRGLPKENILAVPLAKRPPRQRYSTSLTERTGTVCLTN